MLQYQSVWTSGRVNPKLGPICLDIWMGVLGLQPHICPDIWTGVTPIIRGPDTTCQYLDNIDDITKYKLQPIIDRVIQEESRRKAQNANASRLSLTINKFSTTKRYKKHCEKCGKNNHSTRDHWDMPPQRQGGRSGGGGLKKKSGQQKKKGEFHERQKARSWTKTDNGQMHQCTKNSRCTGVWF